MTQASVRFHTLIQDSQTYESFDKNDDHMVSRIVFDLEIAGHRYPNMIVEVRQPYGTKYEEEPLEVSRLIGEYTGPWNHNAFCVHCEAYYRSLVGSAGQAIRFEGAADVRMRGNRFQKEVNACIEIPEEGSAAW